MVPDQFPIDSAPTELAENAVLYYRAKPMRLSIFSRVMIAQSSLIMIIIVISIFAVGKLRLVSQLNTRALTVDARVVRAQGCGEGWYEVGAVLLPVSLYVFSRIGRAARLDGSLSFY